MDKSPVVVFQALSRTQQLAVNVLEMLKQQDGFQSAFFGVQMEDPETGVLCTGEPPPTYLPSQMDILCLYFNCYNLARYRH
jgi:hypothetical protein